MELHTTKPKRSLLRLQFYLDPPSGNIQLPDLEDLALQRKEILELVEAVGQDFARGTSHYCTEITKRLISLTSHLARIITYLMTREQDIIADTEVDLRTFFVLLATYCRSEQDRRWFLQQEVDLFRYRFKRFQDENPSAVRQFLVDNDLHFSVVTPAEINECKARFVKLGCPWPYPEEVTGKGSTLYKVHFTEVLDLVKQRKVYLARGQAYVPSSELLTLVTSRYRAHVSHYLSLMSRSPQDPRVEQIFQMVRRGKGEDIGSKVADLATEEFTAAQVDSLVRQDHLPLCMSQLHVALKRDGHLRHGGRLQYGLFLKGIGLSMEESLKFWRSGFAKKVTGEKFDKQYAYNIRYNYGKEGKRANYTPYSCMRIIMGNAPGTGDHHGCPFRHWDAAVLRQHLETRFPSRKVENVMMKAQAHQYQLACREYFKAVHGLESVDVVINHPNQYFLDSRRVKHGELKDTYLKPAERVKVEENHSVSGKMRLNQAEPAVNQEDEHKVLEAIEMMETESQ